MTSKRKCLTLEGRVKCIKLFESGKSSRLVATKLGVILKRKREILDDYESNGNLLLKRAKRDTDYTEINKLTYQWFLDATARMIPVNGPLLKEKARSIAKDLGFDDFKASNGWLESFNKRHNIVFKTQSGERGEVNAETVEQWKDSVPSICEGYAPENIFNMDETGLFFKDCTRSTFFKKGDSCVGGKRSKERITVALCTSMTGEKLTPLVIGKSQRPRCFGSMPTSKLPVQYYANSKAWMQTGIMEEWLRWLDRKMCQQNQKILLFLDNAPVHPKISLKNVKLQFFPANTTALLQPMDAGIIQTLKLKYRKRQLQRLIVEMDKHPSKTGSQLLREIDVLDATWISAAWKETEPMTINKCFKNCGFTFDEQPIAIEDVNCNSDDEEDIPLALLRVSREFFDCDVAELPAIDEQLATCDNNMTDWDRPAAAILADDQKSDSDDEQDSVQEETVISDTAATEALLTLKTFALQKGQSDILDIIMKAEETFINSQVQRVSKQAKISDFFKSNQ